MKRIPTRLGVLVVLLVILPILFFACQQETLAPADNQDNSETLARISASNFQTKTTVTQGFAGTVFKITRGEWAVGGFVIEDAAPVQANVGVYDYSINDSIFYFRAPDPILIAQVRSDEDGFYQFTLENGFYMVVVSEEELPDTLALYNPMLDMGWFQDSNFLMTTVEVLTDSVRKIDFYLEPQDIYPWWPPDDSSSTWPPDDSTIVEPPSDSGWGWPGDSTDVYFKYMLLLEHNREKVSIDMGVFGTVTNWTSDFMTGDFMIGSIDPARYPVRVYEGISWSADNLEVYPNSMIVKSVFSDLVTEGTPDVEGFYQFELPEGEYSVFAVIGTDSMIYAQDMTMGPMSPWPGLLPPGMIAAGDIVEVDLVNSFNATF
ncbi:MAG: hypothetical protein V2A56_07450 [bacterium]